MRGLLSFSRLFNDLLVFLDARFFPERSTGRATGEVVKI